MGDFNYRKCTLEELWKHVAVHLESEEIGITLVGGGAATIYSKGKYISGDLDFVLDSMFIKHNQVEQKLKKIGFIKDGVIYRHPDCKFTLEYKSPPIEIGEDSRVEPEIIDQDGVSIKILTPTDCIKDRLNKYHLYKDYEAFDAAVSVAIEQGFVIEKVERFCRENNIQVVFEKFVLELGKIKKA